MTSQVEASPMALWLAKASRWSAVVAVGMLILMSILVVLQVAVRNLLDLGCRGPMSWPGLPALRWCI